MAREMDRCVMTEASRAYARAKSRKHKRDVVESVVDARARLAARDARRRRRTRGDEEAREREAIDDAMRKWRGVKGEVVPEMMERAVLETERGGRRRSRRRGRGAAREDGEEEEEEETTTTTTTTTMTHELDVEERYNASEARCANAGLVDDGFDDGASVG